MDGVKIAKGLALMASELEELRLEKKKVADLLSGRDFVINELEARVAELEANAKKTGQRDGLTRADERWLFAQGAEVHFELPPGGGGRIRIKTRRGGVPHVHTIEPDQLFKERSLRSACAIPRGYAGPGVAVSE